MTKAAETPLAVIGDGARRLEEIRESMANLPNEYRAIFATILRAAADELSPAGPPESAGNSTVPSPSGESSVERIADFFRTRANKPATLVEISEGTGIPYVNVRTYVYKRHKGKFVKTPMGAGKSTLWRWAELEGIK
jgi:hypothetical protein